MPRSMMSALVTKSGEDEWTPMYLGGPYTAKAWMAEDSSVVEIGLYRDDKCYGRIIRKDGKLSFSENP